MLTSPQRDWLNILIQENRLAHAKLLASHSQENPSSVPKKSHKELEFVFQEPSYSISAINKLMSLYSIPFSTLCSILHSFSNMNARNDIIVSTRKRNLKKELKALFSMKETLVQFPQLGNIDDVEKNIVCIKSLQRSQKAISSLRTESLFRETVAQFFATIEHFNKNQFPPKAIVSDMNEFLSKCFHFSRSDSSITNAKIQGRKKLDQARRAIESGQKLDRHFKLNFHHHPDFLYRNLLESKDAVS